jgi:hypothetical protein
MKYKHQWIIDLQSLPTNLQSHSLNYKKWKKITFNDNIQNLLNNQCLHIDSVFLNKNLSILNCFTIKNTNTDLFNFAKINKQTLTKIIKRLDKKFNINLRTWYNNASFKFCNSFELTFIRFKLYGCTEECPICLDNPKQIIILDCGHFTCLDCFKSMYHIDLYKSNNNLQSIISHQLYHEHNIPKCPICRLSFPIRYLKRNQII